MPLRSQFDRVDLLAGFLLRVHDAELDTTILRLSALGFIARHRPGTAIANDIKTFRRGTVVHQKAEDRFGPVYGQPLVVGVTADGITVTLDGNPDIGIASKKVGRFVQHRSGIRANVALVEVEIDGAQDDTLTRRRW